MQQSPSAAVTQDAALDVPGRGDVVFVFLGIPLGHQETVIAAAAAGILAAYGGPGSIDGAATLVGIEELADLAEMLVGLAAHGIFRFFIHLGELLARRFKGQLEVLGQTLDGMRVWDIRRAVQMIHFVRDADVAKVELQATGQMGVNALYAAK